MCMRHIAIFSSLCFCSDLPSPSRVCPRLNWSGGDGYLHSERVQCWCNVHCGQRSSISHDKIGNRTNNKVQFCTTCIFHTPFPVSYSRYGEYLGLLEVSPSSLPHSAKLEKALARTRVLLQHQQHTRKKTQLSKCVWLA